MDGVFADYDKREGMLEEKRGGLDDKAHVVEEDFDPIEGAIDAYHRHRMILGF